MANEHITIGVENIDDLTTTVDGVYSVALKVAKTIIENAKVNSKYSDFDKGMLEYGAIIEKLRVAGLISTEFDPNETDFMSPKYPTILKRYFGEFKSKRYDTEVQRSIAKKVVKGETELSEFIAAIINNISVSERQEVNADYPAFFGGNSANNTHTMINVASTYSTGLTISGFLKDLNQYEYFSLPNIDDVMTEIRNVVDAFQFDNTEYSNGFKTECEPGDIRIVVNYKYLNTLDVTKLANVLHLEKTDLMAKIIKTDGLEFTATKSGDKTIHGYGILIVDKNGLGRVTNNEEVETAFVKERFSQWYGKHLDEMYMFDPYSKAYCILFSDSEQA